MHFYICLFNIKADLVGVSFSACNAQHTVQSWPQNDKKISHESWSGFNMFNPILTLQPLQRITVAFQEYHGKHTMMKTMQHFGTFLQVNSPQHQTDSVCVCMCVFPCRVWSRGWTSSDQLSWAAVGSCNVICMSVFMRKEVPWRRSLWTMRL